VTGPFTNFIDLCQYYMPDLTPDECMEIRHNHTSTFASPAEMADELHTFMTEVMGVDKPKPDIAT
jgi:hypothetical protein